MNRIHYAITTFLLYILIPIYIYDGIVDSHHTVWLITFFVTIIWTVYFISAAFNRYDLWKRSIFNVINYIITFAIIYYIDGRRVTIFEVIILIILFVYYTIYTVIIYKRERQVLPSVENRGDVNLTRISVDELDLETGVTCFCLEEFATGDVIQACGECSAPYHAACMSIAMNYSRRCPNCRRDLF